MTTANPQTLVPEHHPRRLFKLSRTAPWRQRSPTTPQVGTADEETSVSPGGRLWRRFKNNRLGYWSLILFLSLYAISQPV